MEIKEIYIYSFGKLKAFRLRLNSGLNTIYEENGYGKTTISMFIKSMLYGLSKDERLRYLPWDNPSSFGGEMTIIVKNEGYKIVREFDSKKRSLDKLHIYSLANNKEANLTEGFAEDWFNLNSEGFIRSAFIPDYELLDFNDDIECRLASIIGGGDDLDVYGDAIKAIELKAKLLRMNSKKGLIIDYQNQIAEVDNTISGYNSRLEGLNNISKGIKKIEDEIESLNNKKNSLKNEVNIASSNIDKRITNAIMERLKGEINSKRCEVNNINTRLNNKNVSLSELEEYKLKANEYETLSLNRLDIKRPAEGELNEALRLYNRIKNNTRRKISSSLIIISILTLIAGIALTILLFSDRGISLIGIVLALVGVLLFIIGFSLKDSSRDNMRLQAILGGFNIYKDSLDEGIYILKGLYYDSSSKRLEDLKNELDSYLSSFRLKGESYNDKIIELEDLVRNKRLIVDDVNNKISEYNSYLSLNNSTDKPYDIKKANLLIDEIDKQLIALNKDLGVLKSKESSLADINDLLADALDERLNLENKLNEAQDELRILNITKELLALSNERMLNSYLSPMRRSLDKYLNLALKIDGYTIDTGFNLSLETENGCKSLNLFSKGLRGILNFLMRLALIDILYDKEYPFIILDDPFMSLDDRNLRVALELIKELGKNRQLIYFTCKRERCVN